MAKTVATLGVSLTAKIGDFQKGFAKATRIASRFSSDLAGHVRTITKYGAAIAGAAATATSLLVKNQLDAVDATSKLSRTLGISTENLVGYQRAAELAGVDSDALAKAVFKLNKSTEAAFTGMSGDQRLLAVADTYQTIGSSAQRAQYLTKLFGKAGLELGSLFESGSAGILQARKETEKLRTAFTSIEGIQVENALDAFSTLQESISGAARRIAVQLAPFIQVASERLTDFATQGDIGGQVVVNAMNHISKALQTVANGIQLASAGWHLFATGVNGLGAIISKTLNVVSNQIHNIAWAFGLVEWDRPASMMESMTDAFVKETESSAQKFRDAVDSFGQGLPASKVASFFEGIQVGARKAVAAASSAGNALAMDDADGTGTASNKTAFARQIDLSRVAIGGVSQAAKPSEGEKKIEDQLKKTNSYLSIMASGRAVVI